MTIRRSQGLASLGRAHGRFGWNRPTSHAELFNQDMKSNRWWLSCCKHLSAISAPLRLLFLPRGCSWDETQDHQTLFLLRCVIHIWLKTYSNVGASQSPQHTVLAQSLCIWICGETGASHSAYSVTEIIIHWWRSKDVTANYRITRTFSLIIRTFPGLMPSSQSSSLIRLSYYFLNI